MMGFNILLIDDEPAQITSIQSFLQRRKYTVYSAQSGQEGMQMIKDRPIDLVFTDYRMPGMNGLEVVQAIKHLNPEMPVVVITAFSQTEEAVQVIKAGAYDYIPKPVNLDELEMLVNHVRDFSLLNTENKLLKSQLKEKYNFDAIISQSEEMEGVLNTAGRIAKSKATVLIRGESGTGKELIARAIHFSSDRDDKPLITVNCSALASNLIESELFGHEKGSFTGAIAQRIGRFEQADGGTLFIDEIGDIAPQTQVKLLRALQFGQFERVGGSKTITVDVRLLTATNRNLEEMIAKGEFREDLLYRINVVTIHVPPLRERKVDIPLLLEHFINKFAAENQKKITGISKEARHFLLQYPYPGNIRELENIVARAVIMARTELITTTELPPSVMEHTSEDALLDPFIFNGNYSEKVQAFERAMIIKALELRAGNQSKAAVMLGMSERHLRSRMQKLNIINRKK